MTDRPLAHIRIGTAHAGRRIADSRGNAGQTLCGAPLTAYDIAKSDAPKLTGEWRDRVCATCRRLATQ